MFNARLIVLQETSDEDSPPREAPTRFRESGTDAGRRQRTKLAVAENHRAATMRLDATSQYCPFVRLSAAIEPVKMFSIFPERLDLVKSPGNPVRNAVFTENMP